MHVARGTWGLAGGVARAPRPPNFGFAFLRTGREVAAVRCKLNQLGCLGAKGALGVVGMDDSTMTCAVGAGAGTRMSMYPRTMVCIIVGRASAPDTPIAE